MSFERPSPADAAFERRLLDSASGDAQPRDVETAWTRFAGSLGAVSLDLGGAPARLPMRAAAAGGRTALAVKWLLVGAIAGSGVTGALLMRRHASLAAPPAFERVTPSASVVAPPPPTVELPAEAAQPHPAKHRLARAGAPAHHAVEPSTLAAQVSRIDTARVAIASGDYDEAMRLIDRYHDDFPDGVLAPDADVVALEAAAAKHDRAEVARRAQSFLACYPHDPHTARVEWLANH